MATEPKIKTADVNGTRIARGVFCTKHDGTTSFRPWDGMHWICQGCGEIVTDEDILAAQREKGLHRD